MLVTAVITTHKRDCALVERALKSVINQTHKEMEIIVVDDSPSDYENRSNIKNMVESYRDNNVIYIEHEKCKGACAARNTGLAAAKGRYIGFLDDDDEWLSNKIEEQLKCFISDDIALVYCGYKTIYDNTGKVREPKTFCINKNVYDKLIYENFIGSTSFPLLRTEALRKIGGFDIEMQSAQDYDVWLRISKVYSINYVDKPLVLYHFHDGEQITKCPSKKVAGLERLIVKNSEFLDTHKEAYWIRHMRLIPWYVANNKRKKAFLIWIKTFLKQPCKVLENARFLYIIIKKSKL